MAEEGVDLYNSFTARPLRLSDGTYYDLGIYKAKLEKTLRKKVSMDECIRILIHNSSPESSVNVSGLGD